MKHFQCTVDDYEHAGDLDGEIQRIKEICPSATNFDKWEEEDYDAEADYEEEYGELDEPIYQGFVSFDAPEKYTKILNEHGYYESH